MVVYIPINRGGGTEIDYRGNQCPNSDQAPLFSTTNSLREDSYRQVKDFSELTNVKHRTFYVHLNESNFLKSRRYSQSTRLLPSSQLRTYGKLFSSLVTKSMHTNSYTSRWTTARRVRRSVRREPVE